MRHLVNLGLLFSFLTLAVTGVLSFLRPFSLVTTRVHIVFGLATLVLVGLHVAHRVRYFTGILRAPGRSGARVPLPRLVAPGAAWLVLLIVALLGLKPVLETLYLDPSVAYSDTPTWGGKPTPRHQILPLWRHRYTMVSGIDPPGEIDAFTGATPTHSFTLNDYLQLGEDDRFVLCVEVNVPGDPNEPFPDPHLGQPSLLYTAYIELDTDQPYALLELTGHGGGAEENGAIQYNLEGLTTARDRVDLLLAHTQPRRSDVRGRDGDAD